jgi:hypothetical protein
VVSWKYVTVSCRLSKMTRSCLQPDDQPDDPMLQPMDYVRGKPASSPKGAGNRSLDRRSA